ncbi:hypothetical protein OG21DRAFT_1215477 [Imleria badia]|nr:hypothetical protein OG21DRAFT_1215477 [Imleria badia]
MLGNGEILRTVEICVKELLDNTHLITFSPTQGAPLSPCSSLLITTERRRSHKSESASDHDDFYWEVSSELAQLTNQGHDALLHYRDDPREANVAASVGYFERALSICPKEHLCYAAVLCNLARAHFIKCQIDGRPVELSTTISYYREALELRPVGHPDRPGTLLYLAEVLLYHCGNLGFDEFPGGIMALASEAQASCSEDSHERRAADLTLQTYTLYKAISSGTSLADIDKSILGLRRAVREIPANYFDRFQRLTNLSLALWFRYVFCSDLDDLDKSISMQDEAMQFTPCGLDSPTRRDTQLLKERVNATLSGFSWKDALLATANFVVPRFSIYRALCERLETLDCLTDAKECLRQMVDELGEVTNLHGEQLEWVLAFRQRSSEKSEHLGDTAVDTQRYNDATSHYETALSLDHLSPQRILIKRCRAFLATGSWKQALDDANQIITLAPSSPWGYEMRHTALQKAGNSAGAFEAMLSKVQSCDLHVPQHDDQYINPLNTRATIHMDDLDTTLAPQHSNRMGGADLLDPASEGHIIFEATDEDRYRAVMEGKTVREAHSQAAGVDEADNADLDEPIKPGLTHDESFQATLVLRRYIKEPFMRLLKVMASVGKRTRVSEMKNMKDTKVTGNFPSN